MKPDNREIVRLRGHFISCYQAGALKAGGNLSRAKSSSLTFLKMVGVMQDEAKWLTLPQQDWFRVWAGIRR